MLKSEKRKKMSEKSVLNTITVTKALVVAAVNTIVLFLVHRTNMMDDMEKKFMDEPDNKMQNNLYIFGTYFLSFAIATFATCYLYKKFMKPKLESTTTY
jgi:hypothetical protein